MEGKVISDRTEKQKELSAKKVENMWVIINKCQACETVVIYMVVVIKRELKCQYSKVFML